MPAHESQPGPARSGLEPPRFTLRTLMIVVTALGCLFGFMSAMGALWSMVILLFVCLALAHVIGNTLGTRLREGAHHDAQSGIEPRPIVVRDNTPVVAPEHLTRRARLGRITLLMLVCGALAGAVGGALLSNELYPESGAGPLAVAVVSAAVLGGFAGFLTSSFISVGRAAWREALAAAEPTRPSRRSS